MKPSEAYEEAAELVQQYGIAKVSFGNRRDGYCALGAVRAAVSPDDRILAMENPIARNAEHVLAGVLRGSGRMPEGWNGTPNHEHMDFATVIQWNDHPTTTKDDLIQVLHEAAEVVRRVESV